MAGEMKIVLSLLSEDQEFQKLQAGAAQRAASQAGFTLEVVYAKNNSTLQLEQLYRFVNAPQAARPVAIIAQPVNDDAFARVARDAARAGIGCVLLNREPSYVQTLRTEHPTLPIAIVTVDQVEIGRIQGRQLRTILPAGGNVLYVQGPSDASAARRRLEGTEEVIAGSKITLKPLDGEWTETSGQQAVVSWLRLSSSETVRIDAIAERRDGRQRAKGDRRPPFRMAAPAVHRMQRSARRGTAPRQ